MAKAGKSKRYYVGMNPSNKGKVFRASEVPTKPEELPEGFRCYAVGPFSTKAGADLCASGQHSPHIQSVPQFEREIRRRAEDAAREARNTALAARMAEARYQVQPCQVWKASDGRTVSPHGALPYFTEAQREREGWQLVQTGWTVYNPLTGQYGIGRVPWTSESEALEWAQTHRPSNIGIGD